MAGQNHRVLCPERGFEMIIDELVEFSNYYGKNNDYVLAGGGNTSAKSGNICKYTE